MASKRLLIIDGNSIVYRAYFGSAFGPAGIITTKAGFPVNAIKTFYMSFKKAVREYDPDYVFVAFDAGKKTFRHDKLESYKGGRDKTPEELIKQFPVIEQMLELRGVRTYKLLNIEADDLIGSAVEKFKSEDLDIFVMSSDKDLLQLVDKGVSVVAPVNGQYAYKVYTNEEFEHMVGYKPSDVPDIKGIVGDASDNLPGVKGVGIKGALKLIAEYGCIEGIYENIDNISGAIKTKLIEGKESAILCKELAQIKCDVELPFNLDDLRLIKEESDELSAFFEEYEIWSLRKKKKVIEKVEEVVEDWQLSFDLE